MSAGVYCDCEGTRKDNLIIHKLDVVDVADHGGLLQSMSKDYRMDGQKIINNTGFTSDNAQAERRSFRPLQPFVSCLKGGVGLLFLYSNCFASESYPNLLCYIDEAYPNLFKYLAYATAAFGIVLFSILLILFLIIGYATGDRTSKNKKQNKSCSQEYENNYYVNPKFNFPPQVILALILSICGFIIIGCFILPRLN